MSALGGSEPQTKGTDEGMRAKASTEQNSCRGIGVFVCDIAKTLDKRLETAGGQSRTVQGMERERKQERSRSNLYG